MHKSHFLLHEAKQSWCNTSYYIQHNILFDYRLQIIGSAQWQRSDLTAVFLVLFDIDPQHMDWQGLYSH